MTSLIPMAISFHSKSLNANSAFAVLSLIMLVFLQQSLEELQKAWKSEIVGNIAKGDGQPLKTLSNGHAISSTRKARLMFAERSFSPPIVEINLKKQVPNVKAVYELPFKVTVENKLRSFQFKLIHNIIPTNLSLYKMNIKDSPKCDRCLFQNETLVHMFCECPDVKIFWKDVIMWWNIKRPDNIDLNSIEILYGYKPEITSLYALNHYLLIAKYHVYTLQETSQRLHAYRSFSPYWKVK